MNEVFTLGRLVGRREAFTTIAGRCSAADAAQLREMRDSKLYLTFAPDWGGFCTDYLHISKESANRLIRNLEEFGPRFFDVVQLTRISADTYRSIAPAIRDEALHHNGEAIALIPENAGKLTAAVREMRKTIEPKPEPEADPPTPVASLLRKCVELMVQLETARAMDRAEFREALLYVRTRIIEMERAA